MKYDASGDYQEMNFDDDMKGRASLASRKSTVARSSGITFWLVICIFHSLVGVFLMGYNTALFNVPEDTIKSNAAQSEISEYLWEVVNAMFPVGALFGAAFSGKLSDRIGRKKMIIINSIINIIASVITATSFYYPQLVIGRFITGIGSGIATVVCSTYLNEVSPDHLRGAVGTLLQLMITIAIVISELLGKIWLIDPLWRIGCGVSGVMCIIQLSLCCTLLESPKWLMAEKRSDEAIKVLKKLRGLNYSSKSMDIPMKQTLDNDTGLNVGFTTIEDDIDKQLIDHNDENNNLEAPNSSLWTGLKQYSVIRRLLFISLFLHMLQQLSGINVVFYYSQAILSSAGFSNTWLGSVLLSIANFIAVVIVTPFVDKLGRRKLLLISSIGMVLSSAAITFAFIFLHKNDGTKNEDEWGIITIICMVLYVMFFEFGLGPIPWVIVAEFTPIEYRGSMVSASQVMNYGCNTLIAATAETLLTALGNYGFLPFGVICAIGSVVIFLYVPETNQKTTKQIIDEMDPNYYASSSGYINE